MIQWQTQRCTERQHFRACDAAVAHERAVGGIEIGDDDRLPDQLDFAVSAGQPSVMEYDVALGRSTDRQAGGIEVIHGDRRDLDQVVPSIVGGRCSGDRRFFLEENGSVERRRDFLLHGATSRHSERDDAYERIGYRQEISRTGGVEILPASQLTAGMLQRYVSTLGQRRHEPAES